MKTLAIIGASYLQRPLVEKTKEMGIHTLCFSWEEGAVCKDLCDEFYPISIIEKEQILQVCQEKQIDGICTIASDVAAPTVAYVAEKMGLVGNSYECALRANNKFLMREALMQAGVECPKYVMLKDSRVNTRNLTLPLIVKPTDRSGSLGVQKVEKWKDLQFAIEKAIEVSFKKEAMVEEFVGGREISVEFISYQGEHYPLQITDKVTTEAPHFVELAHHQPIDLPKEMFERIYMITNKALTALGVTNGASHSEYRITQGGRVVVMEIGARMGGDFIGSDLVKLSMGFDFVRGVIEVALGEFNPLEIHKCKIQKYSGIYFLCKQTEHIKDIMEDAITHPEKYPEVVAVEIMDRDLHDVAYSAQRSGYLIYQSENKLKL